VAPQRAARLAAYLDLLAEWNTKVNLTGARTPQERVRCLVGEVLGLAAWVEPGRLIDVGSGNGSPGLVIGLLRDDVEVTLLEPRRRRWAFLREAARAAGLARVHVLRRRHDGPSMRPARTVTLRALALSPPELAPLVESGGRLVVMGVAPVEAAPFEPEPDPRLPRGVHSYRLGLGPRPPGAPAPCST
jgi:16S rRNA (guanine527-N7)-methyltransferase